MLFLRLSKLWRRATSCAQYVFLCPTFAVRSWFQISRASAAVSSTIEKSTEPIRNTAAYKTFAETLVDALDDSGSAKHAGFEEKEARRLRRQRRLAKAGRDNGLGPASKRIQENPEFVQSLFIVSDF